MKKTLWILLALMLAACGPAAQTAPTAVLPAQVETTEEPAGAPPAAAVTQTMTATVPSAPPSPTSTPEPTLTPSATPFTEPVVAARFPMNMGEDGLGFGSTLLALPGGQVWESTTGGGVRVYDSEQMTVLTSLDLGGKENSLTQLAGDRQHVWALFYDPNGGPDSTNLFRISRADYSVQTVNLPGECTYDNCLWSTLLLDGDIVWVGGYDELLGINRETLEPVTQFLYSEQAHTFNPANLKDLDVTEDGQLWSLFCTDTCYIVILDRQMLLEGVEQEPEMITFINSWVEFVTRAGGTMWAGERRYGNVEEQPAVLYRLDKTGVQLGPADGIALPDELDFEALLGTNHADDGHYLWLLDTSGRKLFWFDPEAGEVAGVLQIYPGDEPTSEDPFQLLSISFDGQFVWGSGAEIVRIAAPWVE